MVRQSIKVEECSFNSIFGTFEGHRIYASRKVAEKIEVQTSYAADLFNVMSRFVIGGSYRLFSMNTSRTLGDKSSSRYSRYPSL